MSNNSYQYCYQQNASNYQPNSQNWSGWTFPQFNGTYPRFPPVPSQFTTPPPVTDKNEGDPNILPPRINPPPAQYYGNSNGPPNRMYPPRCRFPNMSVPPPSAPPQGPPPNIYPPTHCSPPYMRPPAWQQHNSRKRPHRMTTEGGDEVKTKHTKKKKKSLSQTIPSKKDWSFEDAERALNLEKDVNKRSKNNSLIIKFPDPELNRDIVSKFHPAIETVHFQQPSTPRFCFVTLKESEDPNTVIKQINETRFGQGFLMAEYKKDREEDQNIGPEDVDPLTLYVGNLGQEVTKEDMVRAFPKGRRIDIGYAKKMKFTRYAFVSFKSVEDSMYAFKQTHNTQMFNKSLIVRFRRLHGTVGMPGETKTNNPKQTKGKEGTEVADSPEKQSPSAASVRLTSPDGQDSANTSQITLEDDYFAHMSEEDSENEVDKKPFIKQEYSSFLAESFDIAFSKHRPFVQHEIKMEIKTEKEEDGNVNNVNGYPGCSSTNFPVKIKDEPRDEESSDDDQESVFPDMDYGSVLDKVVNHTNKLNALRKVIT